MTITYKLSVGNEYITHITLLFFCCNCTFVCHPPSQLSRNYQNDETRAILNFLCTKTNRVIRQTPQHTGR